MHVLLIGPGDDDMHAQAHACAHTHSSQRELLPGTTVPGPAVSWSPAEEVIPSSTWGRQARPLGSAYTTAMPCCHAPASEH